MEETYENFDNADNIVWSAFTQTIFPNIKWNMIATNTFDEFCGIDQLVTGTTKSGKEETYNVELKCRDFAPYTDKYIKDCWIECDKFEKIKTFENNKNLYVAIYPYVKSGGLIYIWDLDSFEQDELDKIKTKKLMNRQTCKDRNNKILKDVYELPTGKAKMYKFDSTRYYQ